MQQKIKYFSVGLIFFIAGILLAIATHPPQTLLESTPLSQTVTSTKTNDITTQASEKIISLNASSGMLTGATKPDPSIVTATTSQNEQRSLIPVTLKVTDLTYELSMPEGANIYDLLQTAKKDRGLTFTTKSYPALGYLIDSINGIKGGDRSGYYWLYYINGKKAVVGISTYTLKPNDLIEWKYENEN